MSPPARRTPPGGAAGFAVIGSGERSDDGNGTTAVSVTGRSYTSTRPRGLASWRPQARTRVLLDAVNVVLTEYAEHLPLSLRQVFYRLVGTVGYPKDETAYARLCEHLNRARRAGLVPFDAIRDDGTTTVSPGGFTSPAAFWATVRHTAEGYERDLAAGQPQAVEVWVEATGMVPQVARVAGAYGATVVSSGGFDSLSAKQAAAARFVARGRPTVVLHLGDLDPSGCSIVDSAADDVTAFCADYGRAGTVTFHRVAVTAAQVERYQLATAPQKPGDRRGAVMGETVQAEALSPAELADELRDALDVVVDHDALAVARQAVESERAELLEVLDRLDEGLGR